MSKFTDFLNLFMWDTNNSEDLDSSYDIDRAVNDNWKKIDDKMKEINDGKVDKVDGKGLSTNDFTAALLTKLNGIAAGAQVNLLEGLTLGGKALTISNKKIEIKDSEVTNARTSTIKGKTYDTVDARLEDIEENIENIESTRGHVYGVRRKISSNSSSAWERTDDAVGLVANAQKGTTAVQNDFDNLSPWKDIISFNLDLTTGKKKAYFGDADFKFDGTNGDVYTHIPEFWIKIYQENDYQYIKIADYAKAGFIKIEAFDIARYHGSVGTDEILHSYSGLILSYNKSLPTFRTLAKALGDEYCLLDYRQFIIQYLYLVEYAHYNSQSMLGQGICAMRVNNADVALVAESGVNRFIVNTSAGNAFYVGQTISIGTSAAWNGSVAVNRTITAINDYSEGDIAGKEIIFDGAAVNIALTNVIWSSAQKEGGCDSLGMKSGCLVNDGKHSVIYRGIENPFGNVFSWVDGINIKDHQAYICYDPTKYVCDKFETPYEKLGYVNSAENGYSKTLGSDINHPLVQLPTEVGGSNSTYTADYYYQNTGNRVALVGGAFNSGTNGGLWYWYLNYSSSVSYWSIGARVLKYQ